MNISKIIASLVDVGKLLLPEMVSTSTSFSRRPFRISRSYDGIRYTPMTARLGARTRVPNFERWLVCVCVCCVCCFRMCVRGSEASHRASPYARWGDFRAFPPRLLCDLPKESDLTGHVDVRPPTPPASASLHPRLSILPGKTGTACRSRGALESSLCKRWTFGMLLRLLYLSGWCAPAGVPLRLVL